MTLWVPLYTQKFQNMPIIKHTNTSCFRWPFTSYPVWSCSKSTVLIVLETSVVCPILFCQLMFIFLFSIVMWLKHHRMLEHRPGLLYSNYQDQYQVKGLTRGLGSSHLGGITVFSHFLPDHNAKPVKLLVVIKGIHPMKWCLEDKWQSRSHVASLYDCRINNV